MTKKRDLKEFLSYLFTQGYWLVENKPVLSFLGSDAQDAVKMSYDEACNRLTDDFLTKVGFSSGDQLNNVLKKIYYAELERIQTSAFSLADALMELQYPEEESPEGEENDIGDES